MPSITADLPTWNFRPGDPPEYRKLGKTWFVAAGSLLLSSHRSKWWNHFAQPHQDGLPSLLHSILHRSAAPCWKILWVLKKPEFAAQKGCGNASTYHYQDNMSKQFVLESLRRLLFTLATEPLAVLNIHVPAYKLEPAARNFWGGWFITPRLPKNP